MLNGGHIIAKYLTKTCLFKNKTSKKITNNLAIYIRSTLPCSGLIRVYSEPSKQTDLTTVSYLTAQMDYKQGQFA